MRDIPMKKIDSDVYISTLYFTLSEVIPMEQNIHLWIREKPDYRKITPASGTYKRYSSY
jgi:hypothetical protein